MGGCLCTRGLVWVLSLAGIQDPDACVVQQNARLPVAVFLLLMCFHCTTSFTAAILLEGIMGLLNGVVQRVGGTQLWAPMTGLPLHMSCRGLGAAATR